MTIALICITIIAVLVAIYCATTKKKVDTAASNANKKIYEETERLKAEYELYKTTNETTWYEFCSFAT